jgi:hypothetical protein
MGKKYSENKPGLKSNLFKSGLFRSIFVQNVTAYRRFLEETRSVCVFQWRNLIVFT